MTDRKPSIEELKKSAVQPVGSWRPSWWPSGNPRRPGRSAGSDDAAGLAGPQRPRRERRALSPTGLRKVERYLLPTERPVVATRRHWILVVEPALSAAGATVLASLAVVRIGDALPLIVDAAVLATLAMFGRLLWRIIEWANDWFVITDERLLLTYGIFTRRVAVMPLAKVTDLSYNVSLVGRVLRYGEFVFESAGQDQALRSIGFLANSPYLFDVLSEELFGERGIASTRKLRPGFPSPPPGASGGP